MVGVSEIAAASAGFLTSLAILTGVAYRFAIQPIKQDAEEAMATAKRAEEKADANAGDIGEINRDLTRQLDAINDSLGKLFDQLEKQRREQRGTSYNVHVMAQALDSSDDINTENLPNTDPEDFIRGGD